MLVKTKGIIINYIKYQDTSIIARAFTEEMGYTSFIVNSVRSARSKKSIGSFQPFSLLDMVAYVKENRDIHRLSEWKSFHPTHELHHNVYKGTIVLFLSEILGKVLGNQSDENRSIFDFLTQSIIAFDQLQHEIENFHLHFLLKIIPHLGFGITNGDELLRSMELENIHNEPKVISLISKLLQSSILDTIPASGELRFKVLETILSYYNHHDIHIGEIKSLKVLRQVFR
ncbi:MAG: DNA repair protein RecO [Cyclobacteriaceae bacterium]